MDAKTFSLTLEQEFQMRLMEESAQKLNREEMLDILSQTIRLMMVKDNVIRELAKGCLV